MSLKSANKIDTNRYELEIEVSGETFKAAVDKAFRKNVAKMNVPGFRRGKAPRSVVEKLFGESVFYEDAVNIVYPVEYENAVDEAKIDPVDRAEIEVVSVGKEGLVFKAKVTVKPEAELGQYKGLVVQKISTEVTQQDIDAEIKRLQERNARMITVEDSPAQKGNITEIDFEGFVDDVAFEGGKAEKYTLELGSGSFIPGFEEQIEGHNIGDEFDVNVTFPADYNSEQLAGKPAVFKVKLRDVKRKELPEIDDEFAKDVSEFDTLDAMKEDLSKKLSEQKEKFAADEIENKLTDLLLEGLKAEIPQVMIDQATENIIGDMEYRLQSQGMNLKTYLAYTGMEAEDYKKSLAPQAERQVKIRLALEKVAQVESIEVTPEDLEAEYKKAAERFGVDVEKVRAAFSEKEISGDIRMSKAIDFIKSQAVIAEAEPVKEDKPAAETTEAAASEEDKKAPVAEEAKPEAAAPKKARKSTKKPKTQE
ncbi:MAG: trigger factor [Clostridia bacterium]|nr:trigger factor [Clostridia bacterium]